MGAMFLLDLPCLHNNGRGPAHNTFVFWTYTIQFTLTALMQYGSHHLQCREWMVAIFTINQINKTLVFLLDGNHLELAWTSSHSGSRL